jgi:predicted ATPase
MTYVLPILLATLTAEQGALLIIENPEAHLHPKGQLKIGELLALSSLAGVQVVIETHSDHLLNGIRLAVHGGRLPPESVGVHFFEREDSDDFFRSRITSPRLDRTGRLDQWPEGFFDESEKALRQLLRPPSGS